MASVVNVHGWTPFRFGRPAAGQEQVLALLVPLPGEVGYEPRFTWRRAGAGSLVRVPIEDVESCPTGQRCEQCQERDRLAPHAVHSRFGILCVTLCGGCDAVARVGVGALGFRWTPARFGSAPTYRVLAHAEHVGEPPPQ